MLAYHLPWLESCAQFSVCDLAIASITDSPSRKPKRVQALVVLTWSGISVLGTSVSRNSGSKFVTLFMELTRKVVGARWYSR